MKTENILDRYIKANFKLIENELGIACVAMGAAFLLLGTYLGALPFLPLLGGAAYLTYKLMKKLCYESIYGNGAYLFQSLPVTPVQLVTCKIFTAGLSLLLILAVVLFALVLAALFNTHPGAFVDKFMQHFLDRGAAAEQLSMILAAEFLVMVISCFRGGAVILLGVITYQSMPQHHHRWYMKLLVLMEMMAIQALCGEAVEGLFTVAGFSYTLAQPLIQLVLEILVVAAAAKTSIRLVEKKYKVM